MTCELIGGAVFLHIPKTGGSWVYQTLRELGLVRRTMRRYPHLGFERALVFPNGVRRWKEWGRAENWLPGNWLRPGRRMKIPYTFCFVRHPVRWYESWWRYMRGKEEIPWIEDAINRERWLKRWGQLCLPCEMFDPDFNVFMRKLHERFPGYVTWLYGNYAVPEVDFVGRQERLMEDLPCVLRILGLGFDEARMRARPVLNDSKFEGPPIQWDEGLLREVQAAEQTAMIRYGYEPVIAEQLMESDLRVAV